MMFLRVLAVLPFLFLQINSNDVKLNPKGLNVCNHKFSYNSYYTVSTSYTGYENYRTCCKKFIWCTSHCTKYKKVTRYFTESKIRVKYATSYFCCPGWARVGGECPQAVCRPSCMNGKCTRPNVCKCENGFKGTQCETEINECLQKPSPCQQTCTNLHGHYACSCLRGYRKIGNQYNSSKCENINECQAAKSHSVKLCACAPENVAGCQATCQDTLGSFKCQCSKGFRLVANRVCTDEDECGSGTHSCDHICLNKAGGYECACYPGYQLDTGGLKCRDINECLLANGGCEHKCNNVIGSYTCGCKPGYILLADRLSCQDIDECTISRPCDSFYGVCINRPGNYECACKRGYELQYDQKTCKDINECKRINSCQQECVNTDGSYVCSCRYGYKLNADGVTCNDIDECSSNLHSCDHSCLNIPGSFKCQCKPGFILHADGKTCIGLPCKTLYAVHHGTLNCSGFYVGDRCYFGCNVGFELQGVAMKTCLENSRWSAGQTKCVAMQCPAARPPTNGLLVLPCIEEYKSKCIIKCKRGYNMMGPTTMDCGIDKGVTQWKQQTTCQEITHCKPNPCLHHGKCLLTTTSFKCDCTNTGYMGDECEIGEVHVPEYSQMLVGVTSEEFIIKAKPDKVITINLETEPKDAVTFTPSNVRTIHAPVNQVSFRITPKQTGLVRIKYYLTGENSFSFLQPTDGVLFVVAPSPGNRLSAFPHRDLMSSTCFSLDVDVCEDKSKVSLSSTCKWEVSGTRGYVAVKKGFLNLPLSIAGLTFAASEGIKKFQSTGVLAVSRESQEMLVDSRKPCADDKTCSSSLINPAYHKFVLKRNNFLRSYYLSVNSLYPWWMTYTLPHDFNGFHVNDIQSLLIRQHRMKDLRGCYNLPKVMTGTYSVLVAHAPANINIMDSLFNIDSSSPSCTAVNLCQQKSYFSFPKDISITPRLKQDLPSLNVVIKGLGVSMTSKFSKNCINVWNVQEGRLKEECIAAQTWLKTNILLQILNKIELSLQGEMYIESSNIETVSTERFNIAHKMMLEGELNGKITLNVHGKQLNMMYSTEQAKIFTNIGGPSKIDCMLCSTKGIHLNLQAENVKFRYETSALFFKPQYDTNIHTHLFYDVIKGHMIKIGNLPRLRIMFRLLPNSINGLTRRLPFILRMVQSKYQMELKQIQALTRQMLSAIQAVTMVIRSADPKYKNVFSALNKAKQLIPLFMDTLLGLKEAVENEETNQIIIQQIKQSVQNLERSFKQLINLQVQPSYTKTQEIYDGVVTTFTGKICVYNLCFENSVVRAYDFDTNQPSCIGCANLTSSTKSFDLSKDLVIDIVSKSAKQLGSYMRMKRGAVTRLVMSKTKDEFSIEIPATIVMFNQSFDVMVSINNSKITYSVQNVSLGSQIFHDIVARADFTFSSTWDNIDFFYEGKSNINDQLALIMTEKASKMIRSVAERTSRRIQKAKGMLETAKKSLLNHQTIVKTLKSKHDSADRHKRSMIATYLGHQLNLTKAQKQFRSYLAGERLQKLEKLLNNTCTFKPCKEVCYTMALYDMCQDKQLLVANELKCDQIYTKVRTTVEEPFDSYCQLTDTNWIPIYTGTCRKGGQAALKNSLMSAGAGVGGLVGSVFGPAGTAIGAAVGTVVGYMTSLFSSCDESYEVFKQTINYEKKCVLKKFNTRTKVFTITECYPVQRMVFSEYGTPYPCPVSNSTCIPIIDPICMKDNNECRKQRDLVTTRELQKTGVANSTWSKLNYFEIKLREKYVEMIQAKNEAREAKRQYERSVALLKQVEDEVKLSQKVIDDVNNHLTMEKCFLNVYNKANMTTTGHLVQFSNLHFKTSTPLAQDLLFEFYVQSYGGKQILGEFVYRFDDKDISIMHGVRKTIQQYLCKDKTRRKRRSVVEKIANSPLGHHNDYPFTSGYKYDDVNENDAVCLSSKNVFLYFERLFSELSKSVELSITRKQDLETSILKTDDLIQKLSKKSSDIVVLKQLHLLRSTRQNGVEAMNEYSTKTVLQKWIRDMEIYTQLSNFSACLNLEDCFETGLENLKELPSMMKVSRKDYYKQLDVVERTFLEVLSNNHSLKHFKTLVNNLNKELNKLKLLGLFCTRVPNVSLSSPAQVVAFSGEILQLRCKASNNLSISYSWNHNNKTLLFENAPTLRIFVKKTSVGNYSCTAWNRAGKNTSEETFIVLRKKPTMTKQPEDFIYLSTSPKVKPFFVCNVTAEPPAKITWYHKSYDNENSMKLHSTGVVLKINTPNLRSSGLIYCKASNQYGSVTSQVARLDILLGELPRQQISAEFDLNLGRIDQVNKTELEEKIRKDSKLQNKQTVEVDVEAAGSTNIKLAVKLDDNSATTLHDVNYAFSAKASLHDDQLIRRVSGARQSLSEGIERLVSGFINGKDKSTAAEIEKTMVLGFDGDRCQPGYHLHSNGFTCVPCTPGNYGYAGNCISCPIGSYQSKAGQTNCVNCNNTQVTMATGSLNSQACKNPELRHLDLMIILDITGGGSLTQFNNMIKLVTDFIATYIQKGENIRFGIVTFSDSATQIVPLAKHVDVSKITSTLLKLKVNPIQKRFTNKAIDLALQQYDKTTRNKAVVTFIAGETSDQNKQNGFHLIRKSGLKLSRMRIQSIVVGFGMVGAMGDELLALASPVKNENTLQAKNGDNLKIIGKMLASTLVKNDCNDLSRDVLIAIQSTTDIDKIYYNNAIQLVRSLINRLQIISRLKVGVMSFGSNIMATKLREFTNSSEIDAVLTTLSPAGNQISVHKALEFIFNDYATERYLSLSTLKIAVVVSKKRISDDAFSKFTRLYPEDNVRFLNVIMSFEKQDAGVSDIEMEESKKVIYSLSELSALVKRIRQIKHSETAV